VLLSLGVSIGTSAGAVVTASWVLAVMALAGLAIAWAVRRYGRWI